MKALFSTLYLANTLEKALKNKGFDKIEFSENEWTLIRKEKNNLTLYAEPCDSSRDSLESLYIDRAQWYRMLQFLKQLPEQPIVLEISDYGNDDVRLRLSQFVAYFD